MAARRIRGARCLVTGASSGIGRALAWQLAKQGARLLVTARRADRIERLTAELRACGHDTLQVIGDITSPEVRARIREIIASEWQALDILVNNAGSGAYGPFAASEPERLRRILEIDFFASVELTRVCLPWLRRGDRPLVANIGSVLGHRAVPFKSEYCAAKFALRGWSDAVRAEWAREGIDVLLVSPSTTGSEFFEQVEIGAGATRPAGGSRWFPPMSPDTVARHAVRAIQRGRQEIILSWGGRLLVWANRLCPAVVNRLLQVPPSGK